MDTIMSEAQRQGRLSFYMVTTHYLAALVAGLTGS